MIGFVRCQPCLDECVDQELSSYNVDILVDVMELRGEKADNNAQYRTRKVLRDQCLPMYKH